MLRARLATAAVAIPLLLVLIFAAPPWLFAAFVAAIALLGVVEYVSMAFPARPGDRMIGITLGGLVTVAAATGPGPALFAALTALVAGGLVWTVVSRGDFERGLADLGLNLIGALYVGLLLPHFIWLRQVEHGPAWVVFVVATAMLGDSGGYFIGRTLGRHQLTPRVSPGKTVEGALGILLASVITGAAVKLVFLPAFGWAEVLALAFLVGVLGQLGDLSESIMKRAFGAKESGWVFPGHGGVLDRIDSLLFPVSFVYYYLIFVR